MPLAAVRPWADRRLTGSPSVGPNVPLYRIVEAAVELVDARYGALGVLDATGSRLAQFITVGIDEERPRHPPLEH